jgi:hypothetical protein
MRLQHIHYGHPNGEHGHLLYVGPFVFGAHAKPRMLEVTLYPGGSKFGRAYDSKRIHVRAGTMMCELLVRVGRVRW